jgi:hypothetical protein
MLASTTILARVSNIPSNSLQNYLPAVSTHPHDVMSISLRRKTNRPIQPYHFTIEHVVDDDVLHKLGEIFGRA